MKVHRRDILFFLLGIASMLAIDAALNWQDIKQGFHDGYNAGNHTKVEASTEK